MYINVLNVLNVYNYFKISYVQGFVEQKCVIVMLEIWNQVTRNATNFVLE